MAVPDFQFLMLPTLNAIADGQVRHWRDVANSVAASLALSDDQRREMIPSGKMRRFDNRIHWVKAYFTMAGRFRSARRQKGRLNHYESIHERRLCATAA